LSAPVDIVSFASRDADEIAMFFASLTDEDRSFFREDVLAPGVIEAWRQAPAHRRDHRWLAMADGTIVGYVALLPGLAASAHTAELRIVVGPQFRRRGIARTLARHAVVTAAGAGISKLMVPVVADQDATVAMFTALGFEAEGLLRDHVRTTAGGVHDLLLLSHFVDELYQSMSQAGVAGALTGRTSRKILAHLPGGDLELEWAADNHVYMTGEAVEVFSGEWMVDGR
jgi:L-amino acid N-acyltransferase YncA